MKVACLLCTIVFYSSICRAQSDGLPAGYMRDSFPALVQKAKDLLDHSYMAQKLLGVTDTLPGWEGFPVRLYEYHTTPDLYTGKPKTARVYLLNPTPDMLAMWIVTTCWETKKSLDYRYTSTVFERIKNQSGAQFPVKGLVYEDQYTKDFQEPYMFKDGVTVYIADSTYWPSDKTCTLEQIEYYLRASNRELKPQTGKYARIISTIREDYRSWGGKEEVGDADDRKIKWLEVVRELYKKAFRSNRNELMIIWAKSRLE